MSADGAVLWSSDLFDRESPPAVEERCPTLEAGLASLWRRVLAGGVQDDGQPTFTGFTLEVPGRRSVSLPRPPSSNPELARLRWRLHNDEPHLLRRLAALHVAHLDEPFAFAPYLALPVELPPGVHRAVALLAGALGLPPPLEATRQGWRLGPAAGLRLVVRRTDGRGPAQSSFPQAWAIELQGAAPFAVVLEGDAPSLAAVGRVEAADGPAAKTLVDALLEGGVGLEAPGRGPAPGP